MNRILLLLAAALLFAGSTRAQTVFNPTDSVYDYNGLQPVGSLFNPTFPSGNNIKKWVRRPRLTWNSNRYKAYIIGNAPFRLRYPNSYVPGAADNKKYPVLVFFHGGGEATTDAYDDEYMMYNGAQTFGNFIDNGVMDAYVLFLQTPYVDWNVTQFTAINVILDSLVKNAKADEDRIISMGLSIGGAVGAINYADTYPKRVARIIPSAPAFITSYNGFIPSIIHIPVWVGSGGLDTNPDPGSVQNYVNAFTAQGGDITYNLYPGQSHVMWDYQWGEPILPAQWNNSHKANPLLFFNKKSYVCGAAPISSKLGITPGFFQYEWRKDGATIGGATSNEYTATALGLYSVRFKRTNTADWSEWSPNPVSIYSTCPGTGIGLLGNYFNNTSFSGQAALSKIDPTINLSLADPVVPGTGVNHDNFSVRWTGKVQATASEKFTFYISSDDGVRLWVNGQLLIDNFNAHTLREDSGGITLLGGQKYDIKIDYYNNCCDAAAILKWSSPTTAKAIVPQTQLYPDPVTSCATNTAPANAAVLPTQTTATLTWTSVFAATSYDLYLWTGATAPATPTANLTSTSYNATGLATGSLYKWYVVPRNLVGAMTGCAAGMSTFTTAVLQAPPCANNTLPATGTTILTPAKAALSWAATLNAVSYDIYFWTGATPPASATYNTTATSYVVTGLNPTTLYNWYVVPKNPGGSAAGCNLPAASSFTTAAFNNGPVPGKTQLLSMPSVYGTGNVNFHLFKPGDSLNSAYKHPLIIQMDGSGEVGNTNIASYTPGAYGSAGATLRFFNATYNRFSTFYVLVPHQRSPGGAWPAFYVKDMLAWAKANLSDLDTTQMYVTGLETGGGGVYSIIADSIKYANTFAAAASMVGTKNVNSDTLFAHIRDAQLPLWIWQSTSDNSSLKDTSVSIFNWQKNFYPGITPQVKFTFPSYYGVVGSWQQGYDTAHNIVIVDSAFYPGHNNEVSYLNNPNLYEWLLSKNMQRTGPATVPACATNISPVNAAVLTTQTTATLNWSIVVTATSYDVYLWTGATAPIVPTATVTAATYNAGTLTAGTLYNWYVIPKNASGPATGCDLVNRTSFTTAMLVPACAVNSLPANTATIATQTTATLTWSSVPTATAYDVYLWTGATAPVTPTATVTAATTYAASGLTAATVYSWYVVPKNAGGAAAGCAATAKTIFTTASIVVPGCASNILPVSGSTVASQNTAALSWSTVAGATSYDVYLWTGAVAPALPTINVTAASHNAAGLIAGTLYNWYVVPKNESASATGCNFTNASSFTTAAVVVPVPNCATNSSPANAATIATQTTATLTWGAVANATAYDVYIWTGATPPATPTGTVTAATYGATSLIAGTLYNWYVLPKNAGGTATGCDLSSKTSFTTAGLLPVPVCAVNSSPANGATTAAQTTATLSWGAVPTATSYDVYLWTGATIPVTPTATVAVATYGATALIAATGYNWYVVPKNASGAATGCGTNNVTTFTTASAAVQVPVCAVNSLPVSGSTIAAPNTATLTWGVVANATAYDVYVWTGATAPVTPTATVTAATYNATALLAGTLYNWYVTPKNAGGPASGCDVSNKSTFTTAVAAPVPACAVNIAPLNGVTIATPVTANLSWGTVATATSYDVYLWTGATAPVVPTANSTTAVYNATGLNPGTLYNWYIVPKNAAGVASGCDLTNKFVFTTAADPATAPLAGKIRLLSMPSVYGTGTTNFHLYKPGDSLTSIYKHPLIIQMDGSGEAGYNNIAGYTAGYYAANGASMRFFNAKYNHYSTFYVLVPHQRSPGGAWQTFYVKDMLAWAKANLSDLDTTQLYVTGIETGGAGVYSVVADSVKYSNTFAAVASIVGTKNVNSDTLFSRIRDAKLPVWVFDAVNDNSPARDTAYNLRNYQANNYPANIPQAKFTFYGYGGLVGTWIYAYDTGHTVYNVDSSYYPGRSNYATYNNNPNLYEWLLSNNKLPADIILPAPGCATNSSPANGSAIATPLSAALTWGAVTNAASYDVYLWTGATPPATPTANVSTSSYNASGLTAGTLYNWYVVPKNNGGSATGCAVSNKTSFTTAVIAAPVCASNTAPVNGATIASPANAALTWGAVANASSYDVYLWTGAIPPVTATANVTVAAYNATGLIAGTLYNWYVIPKNINVPATGCDISNKSSFTTAVLLAPSCAVNATPANGSTIATAATVTLTWGAAANATSYDVFLWTGATPPATATANVTGTSYGASGLNGSALYTWYIVPKNGAGSAAGCSATASTSFTTAAITSGPVKGKTQLLSAPSVYGTGTVNFHLFKPGDSLTSAYKHPLIIQM
ncbi:MAG: PA14 domain-containing protein, partial [Chitinophagaceae bacterium]